MKWELVWEFLRSSQPLIKLRQKLYLCQTCVLQKHHFGKVWDNGKTTENSRKVALWRASNLLKKYCLWCWPTAPLRSIHIYSWSAHCLPDFCQKAWPQRRTTRIETSLVIEIFMLLVLVQCTVLVIQHHCGQIFSAYLGGWEGHSPVRRECGAKPHTGVTWIIHMSNMKKRIHLWIRHDNKRKFFKRMNVVVQKKK